MNDFIKGLVDRVRAQWLGPGKKLILGVAAVLALIVVVFAFRTGGFTGEAGRVRILGAPVKDQVQLQRMTHSLDAGNIAYEVRDGNVLFAADSATALRARTILIRDDLLPTGTDPWALFDMERWTTTDFERNVNLRRAVTAAVTAHIEALDGVEKADVAIVMPEKELFSADQNPVTASVILEARPGSDLVRNSVKIAGVQKILRFAVEGLRDENIVITDQDGVILNEGTGLDGIGHLEKAQAQQRLVREIESRYRAQVLKALQQIYTQDRVRDLTVRIDMNLSQKSVKTEEFFPVQVVPDDPSTPASEARYAPSVTRTSSRTKTVEQTKTATTVVSDSFSGTEELNKRSIDEEFAPTIGRITVSVNIDGMWHSKYDAEGKPIVKPQGGLEREYQPIPAQELAQTGELVRDAVGFSALRGDSVTVRNIPFDRNAQFRAEDAAYFAKLDSGKLYRLGFIVAAAAAVLVLLLLVFALRGVARGRRSAGHGEGSAGFLGESSESEDSSRADLHDSLQREAVEMARRNPEEVARLIRTWINEESRP